MDSSTRNKALGAIFACVTIYGLTLGLVRPLIALILEARGTEKSMIGLVATMPAFGMLLIALIMPRLISVLGIRRFLFSCLVLDICVLLCYPVFDNIYSWMILNLVAGICTNGLLVASETWINEIAVDATRGRVIGIYNSLLIAAMSLGPLIIPLAGTDGWLPFAIGACFVSLASIPLLFSGKSDFSMSGKASFGLISFVKVAPVLSFAVLLFAWKEFAGASLIPVYGVMHGLEQSHAAVMLTALGLGGLVLTFPLGWLADHVNRYLLLLICGVGILLGALLLPLAIQHSWLLWPHLFIWGGLFNGLYTVVMTILGQQFRGVELVVANISIGILWSIGSMISPSATGFAMDTWEPHGIVYVAVSISSAFILVASLRWLLASDRSRVV